MLLGAVERERPPIQLEADAPALPRRKFYALEAFHMRFIGADSGMAYWFRLWIPNQGKSTATKVQVFAYELKKGQFTLMMLPAPLSAQ